MRLVAESSSYYLSCGAEDAVGNLTAEVCKFGTGDFSVGKTDWAVVAGREVFVRDDVGGRTTLRRSFF